MVNVVGELLPNRLTVFFRVVPNTILDRAIVGNEERYLYTMRRTGDNSWQNGKMTRTEQRMFLRQSPFVLQLANSVHQKDSLVDRVDSDFGASAAGTEGLTTHGGVAGFPFYADANPQKACRNRHHSQRMRWCGGLSDNGCVCFIPTLNESSSTQGGAVHVLFANSTG